MGSAAIELANGLVADDRVDPIGKQAETGHRPQGEVVGVVEQQDALIGTLEPRDGGEHLLQDRGELEAVGEPFGEGVQPGHVGELSGQLVADSRKLSLIVPALDRGGEDVGDRLEKMNVVVRETAAPQIERFERAIGPVPAGYDDDGAADGGSQGRELNRGQAVNVSGMGAARRGDDDGFQGRQRTGRWLGSIERLLGLIAWSFRL